MLGAANHAMWQVSCKALSFCCASTAFLSKTVPFIAVPLGQAENHLTLTHADASPAELLVSNNVWEANMRWLVGTLDSMVNGRGVGGGGGGGGGGYGAVGGGGGGLSGYGAEGSARLAEEELRLGPDGARDLARESWAPMAPSPAAANMNSAAAGGVGFADPSYDAASAAFAGLGQPSRTATAPRRRVHFDAPAVGAAHHPMNSSYSADRYTSTG
eukprot:SAG22_NODE_577_length_8975_cov_12.406827_10_plen_215_part_00